MTQRERIIRYIKDFGSISAIQAAVDLGITQLSARIVELERMGYVFTKTPMTGTNRYGETTHWTRYSFDGVAGKDGRHD